MARCFFNSFCGLPLAVICLAATTAGADPILFSPQYADAAGEGFNDPVLGPSRKVAFEYALNLIGSVFSRQYVGETVTVNAQFNPLGGSATSAVLGQGLAPQYGTSASLPHPGINYPVALINDLFHTDVNSSLQEINITFNTDVDNATVLGNTNWYYGTTGTPSGNDPDFVTVALHELGHGLGFGGFLQPSGAYLNGGNSIAPSIYDYFMNTSSTAGTKLKDLPTDAARAAEEIGDDLYWDGALATAANGGIRAKLYAPTTFAGGSSLYHTDEVTLPNDLMSPVYSGAMHAFSSLDQGMLADMGWTIAPVPEPAAWIGMAVVTCLGGIVNVAARRMRR